MPSVVPELLGTPSGDGLTAALGEALDALLELTGATAGWVGVIEPDGRLGFPASRGQFAPAWLDLQKGPSVWGFAIREGPALYNELPALPALGEPPLHNLLCCPLRHQGTPRGHVALANKPHGFGSPDASAVMGVAHLMGRWVGAAGAAAVPALLRLALDRAAEGALVTDAAGTLVFANAAWAAWTGFRADELIDRPAPFPFWVGHRELIALGSAASGTPLPPPAAGAPRSLGVFPFRQRSGAIFWCEAEAVVEETGGRPLTVAFLRRVAAPAGEPARDPLRVHYSFLDLAEDLPFALALTDRHGQLLWANAAFGQVVTPAAEVPGRRLRACFVGDGARALEGLFRQAGSPGRGPVGRLALERLDATGPALLAYWLAVALPDGPGFLFALSDDWNAVCRPDDVAAAWQRALTAPGPDRLPLLLQPGAEVQFWDERWQALTGLTAADLAGTPSEVVLDWLFPRQADRDRIDDLLAPPPARGPRPGGQAVLDVLTRTGSRPLLCTILPLPGPDRWLLLAGAAEVLAGEDNPALAHVRRFAQGLSHLLNHLLCAPLGAAEQALDRADPPPGLAALLEQVVAGCQRLTGLVGLLQDLGETVPGDALVAPLAEIVREFLDERAAVSGGRGYELKTDLRDAEVPVRVNRRMLKTVLGHLLSNAEQALAQGTRRRIEVRVFARADAACCEVEDSGEGLPTDDWARVLAPFYSTKGPFARDAEHAALEATGLGLTVSQHLLSLHGGRLELRANPGGGTTATIVLPRGDRLPAARLADRPEPKRLRADAPAEPREAHAPELTPALEPPGPEKKP